MGAGVYRYPEEAAAVMETAGAETLSVFPSEIPPGAVRLSAAEEVHGISGGEGWMQQLEGDRQEHLEWVRCLPTGRDGSCQVQSCVLGRIMVGKALAMKSQPLRVWSELSPPIPTVSALALDPALPSCAAYPQHWAASSALC